LLARRALLTLGVAAVALAVMPDEAAADIYVYTDADGVMHFSNKKRGGGKVYVKGGRTKRGRARPGVTPVAPSDKSIERFTRYDDAIREAATLYQIPVELVRAVIKVESNYDPRAVSHAGAQGLMQLMPETALRMQIRDSFNPRKNIYGGVRYLRVLANNFNGDLQLTIAGYNAGGGAVRRYGGIPPYEETQNYVMKVLYYYHRYRTVKDPVVASSM
jgi:soluble lytic murein transglycosylase-like protein